MSRLVAACMLPGFTAKDALRPRLLAQGTVHTCGSVLPGCAESPARPHLSFG